MGLPYRLWLLRENLNTYRSFLEASQVNTTLNRHWESRLQTCIRSQSCQVWMKQRTLLAYVLCMRYVSQNPERHQSRNLVLSLPRFPSLRLGIKDLAPAIQCATLLYSGLKRVACVNDQQFETSHYINPIYCPVVVVSSCMVASVAWRHPSLTREILLYEDTASRSVPAQHFPSKQNTETIKINTSNTYLLYYLSDINQILGMYDCETFINDEWTYS